MILYVNNNGTILPSDAPTIHPGNRGHLYGDGVFESIRLMDGRPLNIQNHITRMIQGARVLKMNIPLFYTAGFFEEKILELINKSGLNGGGRCRLSLDRKTGGAYLPESNDCTFYIEVYPYLVSHYELNAKGLEIDIYRDIKLHKNFLSNFKTKTGIPYVMASISANEQGLDDLLLTNDKGNILESGSYNVFIVSNGVLYTPSLDEGCIAGTMRMQIINLALLNNIKIYECNILPQNLLSADEVFLTNAIRGINWVGGYRTKRYQNNMSRRLVVLLNAHWENELGI
jgi:branched-chain amino acid aminotransferase